MRAPSHAIFSAVSGLLFLSLVSDSGEKAGGDGERKKTRPQEGVRARGAARCVPDAFSGLLLFGAIPAHELERPPEPWQKGVHPTQAAWGRREHRELVLEEVEITDWRSGPRLT